MQIDSYWRWGWSKILSYAFHWLSVPAEVYKKKLCVYHSISERVSRWVLGRSALWSSYVEDEIEEGSKYQCRALYGNSWYSIFVMVEIWTAQVHHSIDHLVITPLLSMLVDESKMNYMNMDSSISCKTSSKWFCVGAIARKLRSNVLNRGLPIQFIYYTYC